MIFQFMKKISFFSPPRLLDLKVTNISIPSMCAISTNSLITICVKTCFLIIRAAASAIAKFYCSMCQLSLINSKALPS